MHGVNNNEKGEIKNQLITMQSWKLPNAIS